MKITDPRTGRMVVPPDAKLGGEYMEWQQAKADALASLRSIPNPRAFARSLQPEHVMALHDAYRTSGGWRVDGAIARELRIMGLVGFDGPYLTAYGFTVRRVILAGDA